MSSSSLTLKYSRRFRKDVRRLSKSGINLSPLYEGMDLLSRNMILPKKFRDHKLKGAGVGIRECHLRPDWLLVYSIDYLNKEILIIATGTHRDVFGIE